MIIVKRVMRCDVDYLKQIKALVNLTCYRLHATLNETVCVADLCTIDTKNSLTSLQIKKTS